CAVCLVDQASCGCCLIQKQMKRLELRSAFSVALNNDKAVSCYGPFPTNKLVIYKYVFINLGGNYNIQTGIFTVPRSGVYSLSVTIYGIAFSVSTLATCANLQVNNQVVATLSEQNGQDLEDSATAVVAVSLKAGDQVAVNLLRGCCFLCEDSYYNTFSGFLLYPTE
uniref:Cerebellin 20 n=1 Tax=Mastacembelus armatus TaxID=205130 RepID=A0A7N8YG82_9TELE